MGIFNIFGKKKKTHISTSVEIIEHDYTESPKYLTEVPQTLSCHKSKNGLYFKEILMLSYAEKYLSGKSIARFWEYDYNVTDVMALLKSLEKRGFIADGKLTELGKNEISENGYVLYLHRHKKWGLDAEIIGKAVADYPKNLWHDAIWGEFNRLYSKCTPENTSKRRFIKQSMYEFLLEEKNYAAAFDCLAEIFFIDLNCYAIPEHDPSLAIAPGLKDGFKKIVTELNMDDHQMIDRLMYLFNGMVNIYHNYSNKEVAFIITGITFGMEEKAMQLLNKKRK